MKNLTINHINIIFHFVSPESINVNKKNEGTTVK